MDTFWFHHHNFALSSNFHMYIQFPYCIHFTQFHCIQVNQKLGRFDYKQKPGLVKLLVNKSLQNVIIWNFFSDHNFLLSRYFLGMQSIYVKVKGRSVNFNLVYISPIYSRYDLRESTYLHTDVLHWHDAV